MEAIKKNFDDKVEEVEKSVDKKLIAIEKNNLEKINMLENQLKNLTGIINEKDNIISSLKKHCDVIDDKLANQVKETSKLKVKLEKVEGVKQKKENMNCPDCHFVASSKHGLKVHIQRKHTCKIENNPKTCEICEEEFVNPK